MEKRINVGNRESVSSTYGKTKAHKGRDRRVSEILVKRRNAKWVKRAE
jgi:hypothetical protein